jgi:rubredoxin
MPRERECPECGAPLEHQQDEPDVGIVGGWFCTACDFVQGDEDDDDDDVSDDRGTV